MERVETVEQAHPLVGAWRLVRLEGRTRDGETRYPLGQDPQGLLIYTADGYVSVSMMASHRPALSGDLGTSSIAELRGLARYVSYAGRYHVEGNSVVHQVEITFIPNHLGRSHVRTFRLEDDTLALSSSPMLYQGEYLAMFQWWVRTVPHQAG
ncbi:MAG: lipocalin-like domain-containing protein [Alicyclobacillus sp.]|nr:lipocalin-like domain-containing protein [Alicyclobacillus sp.]